jgi:phage-related protein
LFENIAHGLELLDRFFARFIQSLDAAFGLAAFLSGTFGELIQLVELFDQIARGFGQWLQLCRKGFQAVIIFIGT